MIWGNPADFDALYQAQYARLVGELAVVTGNMAEAEEVVQEAFLRAFVRWRRVSGLDEPAAWVRRVALNLAISRWRRTVRGAAAMMRLGPPRTHAVDEGPVLVAALAALPRDQRAVLVLHYEVGLPVRDVATRLGIAEGTVKSRLSRARTRLAMELAKAEANDE